jgi:mycothiol system anti-sigma-R factor
MSIDEPELEPDAADLPPPPAGLPVGLSPMQCQPSLEVLYRYMDGQLDSERQAMIASHLRHCQGCDDFYHFQSGLRDLLGARCRSELPADLPKRIFGLLGQDGTER